MNGSSVVIVRVLDGCWIIGSSIVIGVLDGCCPIGSSVVIVKGAGWVLSFLYPQN